MESMRKKSDLRQEDNGIEKPNSNVSPLTSTFELQYHNEAATKNGNQVWHLKQAQKFKTKVRITCNRVGD